MIGVGDELENPNCNFKTRFPSPLLTTGIVSSFTFLLFPLESKNDKWPWRAWSVTLSSARKSSLGISFPLRTSLLPLNVRVDKFTIEFLLFWTFWYSFTNSVSFWFSLKDCTSFKISRASAIVFFSSSEDKSATFETASVNSSANLFNPSLVAVEFSVASFFVETSFFSTPLIDFKIDVNELISFAFLSTPDCVAPNALKYCLASATSFSAFWIWDACFLFPRMRSIWASKSANFACSRDKSTDGFVVVSSAVLVLSEPFEACSVSFSLSFTAVADSADFSSSAFDFSCSANSVFPATLSTFGSEIVPAWAFPWAWLSPVSASFVTTVSVAESASTVSTL